MFVDPCSLRPVNVASAQPLPHTRPRPSRYFGHERRPTANSDTNGPSSPRVTKPPRPSSATWCVMANVGREVVTVFTMDTPAMVGIGEDADGGANAVMKGIGADVGSVLAAIHRLPGTSSVRHTVGDAWAEPISSADGVASGWRGERASVAQVIARSEAPLKSPKEKSRAREPGSLWSFACIDAPLARIKDRVDGSRRAAGCPASPQDPGPESPRS